VKVVFITGSRDWRDVAAIRHCLDASLPELVVHGGCPSGADAIAHRLALGEFEVDVLVMRARWRKHGKGAGHRRNQRMADKAAELHDAGHDVKCFAFPLGESRGTRNCIEHMHVCAVRVVVFGEEAG
jgi:hypothetical protein